LGWDEKFTLSAVEGNPFPHRQLGNVIVGSPSARARQPILSVNWNFYLCPATAGLAKSGLHSFLIEENQHTC